MCTWISSQKLAVQDAAWREQQRRLLSAHFGPREVESLAMNAVLPLDRDEGCVAGAPLLWVQQREMKVCPAFCFIAAAADLSSALACLPLMLGKAS